MVVEQSNARFIVADPGGVKAAPVNTPPTGVDCRPDVVKASVPMAVPAAGNGLPSMVR